MSYFYNTPLESLTGIVINFERTSTSWQPGKFLKTKVRTHDENAGCIEEITGVCTAIQVNTSVRGEEALMKVKLQLEPWDNPSLLELSFEAIREIENLGQLTTANCSSIPKLIDQTVYQQNSEMPCPNGYVVFILMEQVPGQNLRNFGDLSLTERDEVRIAFIRALWEFRSKGYGHSDTRRSNIVWDRNSQRCFNVDLEDAYELNLPENTKITLNPFDELTFWRQLRTRDLQPSVDYSKNDPMIPEERTRGQYVDNLEEALALLRSSAAKGQN